jgi:hypothetical protein
VVGLLVILFASPVLPPPTPGSAVRHAERGGEPCSVCHPAGLTSTRAADRLAPVPSPLLVGAALHFDHQRHAARGAACAACHTAGGWPTKADCARCHEVTPADTCATCHPAGPDGRLLTATSFGLLRPADHGGDFSRAHAAAARQAPETCETCHSPPDCQRCHAGRIRPISVHPGDFIARHGPPARRNDPECGTCHRLQTFCVGCHAQSGLALDAPPRSFGSDGRDRAQFHPPGFGGGLGDVPGPDHHRNAARRNLAECVSCHQESDCVRCHATQATTRLRASPHPATYAATCRNDYETNPRSCLKCHTTGPDPGSLCR